MQNAECKMQNYARRVMKGQDFTRPVRPGASVFFDGTRGT